MDKEEPYRRIRVSSRNQNENRQLLALNLNKLHPKFVKVYFSKLRIVTNSIILIQLKSLKKCALKSIIIIHKSLRPICKSTFQKTLLEESFKFLNSYSIFYKNTCVTMLITLKGCEVNHERHN